MARCIWLDGGVVKACRVLRARLELLGYRILCRTNLPDPVIVEIAERMGCVIVTTDEFMARRYSAVYIPMGRAAGKSARDLATLVIKTVLGRG